jgi:hypothetical protein
MEFETISPRPLADVAVHLEQSFNHPVSYEDAPYCYPGDMVLDEAGRCIPRGGRIFFEYQPGDHPRTVLDKALEMHVRSGFPGFFMVEEYGGHYHIVPYRCRNTDGAVVACSPLLNSTISLPSQTRSGLQFVEDVARALNAATGASVEPGTIPTNCFQQHVSTTEASEKRAGDLLLTLFHEMGKRFSWQLFNDPGTRRFSLNIHPLPVSIDKVTIQ